MDYRLVVRNWLKTYWLALMLGGGFILSGFVWMLPMRHDEIYAHQLFDRFTISLFFLGFLSLPLEEIYYAALFPNPKSKTTLDLQIYLLPDSSDKLIAALIFIAIGMGIGIGVWGLLRIKRIRKLIAGLLLVNFVLGVGIIAYGLFISGAFNRQEEYSLQSFCEVPISQSTALRVQYFDSWREQDRQLAGIPKYRELSYQITRDDGNTWQEFIHITFWQGDCDQIQVYNEHFVWFWEQDALFITHDGGETWHLWQSAINKAADTHVSDQIEVVTFTDELNGQMQITRFDYDTQIDSTYNLTSTDGGYTWVIQ